MIDVTKAKLILINSFINEYRRYLEPEEIDSKLNCWFNIEGTSSVEHYYSDYFDTELEDFKNGKLYWLEATIGRELVAWATYERHNTPSNSCYMNLLVVDPKFSRRGLGKQLVMAVPELKIFPKLRYINLLLRKKNQGGRVFYSKLGFKPNPEFKRENFVDTSLLEGWTLELK